MSDPTAEIPRVVWTFWLQGWSAAPRLVRACLESWRRHNPGWDVRALSRSGAAAHIDVEEAVPSIRGKQLPPMEYSECLRVSLLARFGGVWVDATVFCTQPLDVWLPGHSSTGFFAFERPGPDRLLSSWFLAASPGSYVVESWRRAVSDYWTTHSRRHTYFWFHYLFGELYERDAEIRRTWDATPTIPADGPHYFWPYDPDLFEPLDEGARSRIDGEKDPVYKLTHKIDETKAQPGSVLAYLCGQRD